MNLPNNSFVLNAPAKVNLYLHVTGKREDGYHKLDSLTVFAQDFADTLYFTPSDEFSFSVEGPFAHVVPEDNLVTRAVRMMEEEAGKKTRIHIRLVKNIPAGAGLGGGSADAAACLKGLEKILGITAPKNLLLKLGADVPACYHGKPCRFSGIGEIIEDVPALPDFSLVVLWPDCHSMTKDVFSIRDGGFEHRPEFPASFPTFAQLVAFLNTTHNGLSMAAEYRLPSIKDAREYLQNQSGCMLARMSGSGSAVFGLFEAHAQAEKIAGEACQSHPSWFVAACRI